MARRREALESHDPLSGDADVVLRHRRELAPQRVEGVAIEPPRASLEPGGIDEVRCADLRHPDRQPGMLADEHSRRARVVEVDVREEQMPDVLQLVSPLREPRLQRRDADDGPQSKRDSPWVVSST